TIVREALKRIPRGTISVDNNLISYRQASLETNTETLYGILQAMGEIAKGIEGKGDKSGFGASALPAEDAEPKSEMEQAIMSDPFYQKKAPQADAFGAYG